jgi:hypothetical protein
MLASGLVENLSITHLNLAHNKVRLSLKVSDTCNQAAPHTLMNNGQACLLIVECLQPEACQPWAVMQGTGGADVQRVLVSQYVHACYEFLWNDPCTF